MAPYSPAAIKALYPLLEKAFPSAKRSGILALKPGYHNARSQLPKTDYSRILPVDLLGDKDAASAIDCTMNTKELGIVSRRLMTASKAKDPRLQGKIREWFGSFDGDGVDGYSLLRGRVATSDDSHEWHFHISGYRRHANDRIVWLGIAEVLLGLPAGALTKDEPTAPLPPTGPLKPNPPKPVIDLSNLLAAIKSGEYSAEVRALQGALNDWRGSLDLVEDGLWGPKTRGAVETYQAWKYNAPKSHPDIDGIPGSETLGHLGFEVKA